MRGALCACAREHRFDGLSSPEQMLVKPSGKLVIAKDNAKSIRSLSAMFIARWHSARSSWGAPAAPTTCRDGYQGRLPAAIDGSAKYLRANLRAWRGSPQWGNSEWIGGMYDEPADGCRGFLIGVGVQTNCAHVQTKPLVLFPITGFSDRTSAVAVF